MSFIERTNPLNLQYLVCIVTAASTPLGMVICKTLLKANALVMGVDTRPKDDSLNAREGTHFQFEQCDVSDAGTAERIIEAAGVKYGKQGVDILVNVVETGDEGELGGLKSLSQAVGKVMAKDGKACIINVPAESAETKQVTDFTKEMLGEHKGIRCNVVAPSKDDANGKEQNSKRQYEAAKSHMKQITNPVFVIDSNQTPEKTKLYNTGNLTLFLAGGMGADVSGSVVYRDGSSSPL